MKKEQTWEFHFLNILEGFSQVLFKLIPKSKMNYESLYIFGSKGKMDDRECESSRDIVSQYCNPELRENMHTNLLQMERDARSLIYACSSCAAFSSRGLAPPNMLDDCEVSACWFTGSVLVLGNSFSLGLWDSSSAKTYTKQITKSDSMKLITKKNENLQTKLKTAHVITYNGAWLIT